LAKSRKHKFLFVLLALFFLYVFWLGFNLLRFKTYGDSSLSSSSREIKGAYHIHSLFSDGRKSIDEIAKLAAQKSLDFIIITDHGHPNLESLAEQGWKQDVLVLAGSELSVSRGHLVGLGFDVPHRPFSQNTEDAVLEIQSAGGFSIIAHPYSKVSWTWGEFIDYSGIDIINANTYFKKNFLGIVPYLPAFLVKPKYALLRMLKSPERNLRKWDELNLIHPIYGYYSIDAHLLYGPLLDFLHLHLLLREPLAENFGKAKDQILTVLRKGRFYNAIDAAAQATGFRFWAEAGQRRVPMGDVSRLLSPLVIHIRAAFPFSKEIYLIRNGKRILHSQEDSLVYEVKEAGIYRVEVYLKERSPLAKNIPWILSNPIFIRKENP
jgi:hypothetical protein